jgi:hypothetical protein
MDLGVGGTTPRGMPGDVDRADAPAGEGARREDEGGFNRDLKRPTMIKPVQRGGGTEGRCSELCPSVFKLMSHQGRANTISPVDGHSPPGQGWPPTALGDQNIDKGDTQVPSITIEQ